MSTEPGTDVTGTSDLRAALAVDRPLVERLRAISNWPFDIEPLDCSVEAADAADEIERLRSDMAIMHRTVVHQCCVDLQALRAEAAET